MKYDEADNFMKRLTASTILMLFVLIISGSCLPLNNNPSVTSSIPTTKTQSVPVSSLFPASNTLTSSVLPTSTALPLISSENGRQMVSRLLTGNGSCQLPCVLGLTPGKSFKGDALNLIAFFSNGASNVVNENDSLEVHGYEDSILRKGSSSSSGVIFWNNGLMTKINIDYFYDSNDTIEQINLSSGSWKLSGQNETKSSSVVYGDQYFSELLKYYSVDRILALYGAPQQILVLPFPDDPGHPSPPAHYPFSLVLFYPEYGFLVEYSSARQEQNEYYVGCPAKSHITLAAWNPKIPMEIENAVKYFPNIYGISLSQLKNFRQLQEVTTLSVDGFYEQYKNPNFSECVQTPKSLWH